MNTDLDLPNLRTALRAGKAADRLRAALEADATDEARQRGSLTIVAAGAQIELPVAALDVLLDALEDLSEGRTVTVAPADVAVGTIEAARLLGMSRPSVTRLFDEGELCGEVVGSKRRIQLGALVARRRERAAALRATADALAESQSNDMTTDQEDLVDVPASRLTPEHVVCKPLAPIIDRPVMRNAYSLGYGLAA